MAQAQARPVSGTVYVLNGSQWQEAFIVQATGRISGGGPSWSYAVQYFDGNRTIERNVSSERVRTIEQAQTEGLTDNVYDLSSQTGIDQILATHNDARRQVGVPDLAWSNDLAASAQSWAETLIAQGRSEHSPLELLDGGNIGENLAAYRTTGRSPSYTAAARAAQGWVDERLYYDYDANRCAPGQICGHYTQIVWADTTEVGCGMARSANEQQEVWVCHYNPGGNFVGQRPY
ncbi:MAG: CAP domain-containing protein [Cyanobacteria bacterium J06632_22]